MVGIDSNVARWFVFAFALSLPVARIPAFGADSYPSCSDMADHLKVLEEGKQETARPAMFGSPFSVYVGSAYHPFEDDVAVYHGFDEPNRTVDLFYDKKTAPESFPEMTKWAEALGPGSSNAAVRWEACGLLNAEIACHRSFVRDGALREGLLKARAEIAADPVGTETAVEFQKLLKQASDCFEKALAIRMNNTQFGSLDEDAVCLCDLGAIKEASGDDDAAFSFYKRAAMRGAMPNGSLLKYALPAKVTIGFCLAKNRVDDIVALKIPLLGISNNSHKGVYWFSFIEHLNREHRNAEAQKALRDLLTVAPDAILPDYLPLAKMVPDLDSETLTLLAGNLKRRIRVLNPLFYGLQIPNDESSVAEFNLTAVLPVLSAFEKRGKLGLAQDIYEAASTTNSPGCLVYFLQFCQRQKDETTAARLAKLLAVAVCKREQVFSKDMRISLDYLTRALQGASPASEEFAILNKPRLQLADRLMRRECLDVSQSLTETGCKLESQDSYALAEKMYREALAIKEKNLTPDDPYIATELCNVARVCGDRGAIDRAVPLYERALAIYRKNLRENRAEMINALTSYAESLERAHRKAAAELKYAEARKLMAQAHR
ncbi:MAG TPA: tetratricopeptide repeat protein [Chroococcales cyanobacterium]